MPGRATERWCAKCGDGPRAPSHAYCAPCRNDYQRAYKARRAAAEPAYRARSVSYARKRLYGVTEDRYTELWAQQGGVCAICLLGDDERDLHVDHCHETGRVRALLCAKCNGGIGMFKDNPRLMHRAADYVAIYDN